jgi:Spy/CpxP family protein refolding chaperone
MLRSGMLLIGVLLAGIVAFAQDSPQTPPATPAPPASAPAPPASTTPRHNHMHGDRAEQKLNRLSKRFDLTDDQKEKIRPILQDEEKKLTDLDNDSALTQQQKHRKTREIRMSSKSQMEAILTPEQKEKMPSAKAGRQGRRHGYPGSPNPPNADSGTPQ